VRNSCDYCGPTLFADHTNQVCRMRPLGTYRIGGTDTCTPCEAANGYVGYVNPSERNACRYCGSGKHAVAGDTNDCLD